MAQNTKKKTLIYMGKKYTYTRRNEKQLRQKTGLTQEVINDLIDGKNTTRYLKKNNKVYEYDIKDKPLVYRELGIKRIPKGKYGAKDGNIKNFKIEVDATIQEKFNSDNTFFVLVNCVMFLDWGSDSGKRKKTIELYGTKKEILQSTFAYMRGYALSASAKLDEFLSYAVVFSMKNEKIDKFGYDPLYSDKPLSLKNYFDGIDDNNNKNCANYALKKLLPRISPKTIDAMGEITSMKIKELCIKYSIEMYCYGGDGKIKINYVPLKRNRTYPILKFMDFDGHFYPILSDLKIKKITPSKVIYVENIAELFKKYIEEDRILPNEPKCNGIKIISFIVGDVKYISNSEYFKCLEILKKFDLENEIYDEIELKNLFSIIEKKYIPKGVNISSFYPNPYVNNKAGFNYMTSDNIDLENVVTIDKNKQHLHSLKSLNFLISTDYRTSKINKKINKKCIVEHYEYIVKPKKSSILLEMNQIYSGEHLNRCLDAGVEFEIIEEMTYTKHPNYYKQMIEDMEKLLNPDDLKIIGNVGIGMFGRDITKTLKYTVDGIFNKTQEKQFSGYNINISDNYVLKFNTKEIITNLYDKRPILRQIKDNARFILYKKMLELNIKMSDIVQIKTDAISYYGNKPNDLDFGLDGWKEEEFKPFDAPPELNEIICETFIIPPFPENKNELYLCLAGTGKTYKAINNIIPEYKNDYHVVSPSHASLEEYRENKLNCDVIQKFTFKSSNNKIIDANTIITDEIGMVDKRGHDFLIKEYYLGKNLISLGDFGQLPPPKEDIPLCSEQYLNWLYPIQHKMTKNFRNNFTEEYYDYLKNLNDVEKIKDEILKYRIDKPEEAETIICYRNETRKKYNKIMMDHLNLNKYSVGLRVILKSNKLNYLGVYNNYRFVIDKVTKNIVSLKNDPLITKTNITIDVPTHTYDLYFEPAYAITLHCAQGKSLNSFYFPDEDIRYINGRGVYTLISRLKNI